MCAVMSGHSIRCWVLGAVVFALMQGHSICCWFLERHVLLRHDTASAAGSWVVSRAWILGHSICCWVLCVRARACVARIQHLLLVPGASCAPTP